METVQPALTIKLGTKPNVSANAQENTRPIQLENAASVRNQILGTLKTMNVSPALLDSPSINQLLNAVAPKISPTSKLKEPTTIPALLVLRSGSLKTILVSNALLTKPGITLPAPVFVQAISKLMPKESVFHAPPPIHGTPRTKLVFVVLMVSLGMMPLLNAVAPRISLTSTVTRLVSLVIQNGITQQIIALFASLELFGMPQFKTALRDAPTPSSTELANAQALPLFLTKQLKNARHAILTSPSGTERNARSALPVLISLLPWPAVFLALKEQSSTISSKNASQHDRSSIY